MRVISYYRVSSGKQAKAETITSQRTSARALVAARGWTMVAEYEDDGRTARAGHLHQRPGFAQLLADVRAKKCEAVIIVGFDRLSRATDLAERGAILGALQ